MIIELEFTYPVSIPRVSISRLRVPERYMHHQGTITVQNEAEHCSKHSDCWAVGKNLLPIYLANGIYQLRTVFILRQGYLPFVRLYMLCPTVHKFRAR